MLAADAEASVVDLLNPSYEQDGCHEFQAARRLDSLHCREPFVLRRNAHLLLTHTLTLCNVDRYHCRLGVSLRPCGRDLPLHALGETDGNETICNLHRQMPCSTISFDRMTENFANFNIFNNDDDYYYYFTGNAVSWRLEWFVSFCFIHLTCTLFLSCPPRF